MRMKSEAGGLDHFIDCRVSRPRFSLDSFLSIISGNQQECQAKLTVGALPPSHRACNVSGRYVGGQGPFWIKLLALRGS